MTNVYELSGVSFTYGEGVSALQDVDLTVGEGERIALLGANGSGKSTLLRILGGLSQVSSGEVRAFGDALTAELLEDEARAQVFRRRVGIVFQNADAQLFSPTVRDEIAFGPLHLGLSRSEALHRVEDMVELFGLGPLVERPPYKLSGGEQKKVALAAVLAVDPEVLLFDEPMGGLDPRTRQWLVEFLEALHKAGKTLIVATHELGELERLADRGVVLGEDHRLAADGPLREVFADRDLLLAANLIHEHAHVHGSVAHSHAHAHASLAGHPVGPAEIPAHEHLHDGRGDLHPEPHAEGAETGRR
jgi:cobalt/nickel transport system ATP-binding protein